MSLFMISNRCKHCGRYIKPSIYPTCGNHGEEKAREKRRRAMNRKFKNVPMPTQESLQRAMKDYLIQAGRHHSQRQLDSRVLQRRNTI